MRDFKLTKGYQNRFIMTIETIEIGQPLPKKLHFKATGGLYTNFDHFKGQWLILYFYPKDATPGCTTQGCDFRDLEKEFSLFNATIFGVSRDSLISHEKFKANQGFPFELISDEDEAFCDLFDVMRVKPMYGKQVRGIERSTFLIDPNGVLREAWHKVKVDGHVDDVFKTLKRLQGSA